MNNKLLNFMRWTEAILCLLIGIPLFIILSPILLPAFIMELWDEKKRKLELKDQRDRITRTN